MARYHANPTTGNVGACRAQPGNCPFGDESIHGSTKEEAMHAYEARMASGADPSVSAFATLKKKPSWGERIKSSTEGLKDALRRVKQNARDFDYFEHAPKLAVAGGLATMAIVGGGMAAHSAQQDYTPVTAEVVSSQVHTYTQTIIVNKVPVITTMTDTAVTVRLPGGEQQTAQVTLDGAQNPSPGSELQVYDTGGGHVTGTEPGSSAAYGEAAAVGALSGVAAGVFILVGSMAVEDRKYWGKHWG